jgi:hypothetical protein
MDDYFVVFSTGEYLSRVRGFFASILGGQIWITENPEGGTIFNFTISKVQ